MQKHVLRGRGESLRSGEIMKKIRLDQALVERAFYQSREQAQRAIMAGQVRIGEQVAQKPSILVGPNAMIATAAAPSFRRPRWIKIEGALDFFGIDVRDQIAVDIGASTGGFTDCLLQRGARKVYAIDVGHGQLAWKIRNDPRVTVFEKQMHARFRHRSSVKQRTFVSSTFHSSL